MAGPNHQHRAGETGAGAASRARDYRALDHGIVDALLRTDAQDPAVCAGLPFTVDARIGCGNSADAGVVEDLFILAAADLVHTSRCTRGGVVVQRGLSGLTRLTPFDVLFAVAIRTS